MIVDAGILPMTSSSESALKETNASSSMWAWIASFALVGSSQKRVLVTTRMGLGGSIIVSCISLRRMPQIPTFLRTCSSVPTVRWSHTQSSLALALIRYDQASVRLYWATPWSCWFCRTLRNSFCDLFFTKSDCDEPDSAQRPQEVSSCSTKVCGVIWKMSVVFFSTRGYRPRQKDYIINFWRDQNM